MKIDKGTLHSNMHAISDRVALRGLMDGSVLSPLTMCCVLRFALYLYLLVMPLCDGMLTIKSCDDKKDNEMMWINSYQIFV